MGWETRKGRTYYYRKRRRGGRVVSEYVGCDDLAHAIAHRDAYRRRLDALRRARDRAAREKHADTDAGLREAHDLLRLSAAALLRLAGFHQHKGTWRRTRHAQGH